MTKSNIFSKIAFLSSLLIALGFCQHANAQFIDSGGSNIINNNSNGKVVIGNNSNLSFNVGSDMLVGPNRFAFRYETGGGAVTNFGLRFSAADGAYQFTDGTGATLLGINATTGNTLMNGSLSFGPTADYLVGPNRYAFRYQSAAGTVTNFGLLFNATSGQYQFLDNAGSSIVGIDAGTGNTQITGSLTVASATINNLATAPSTYEMVVADENGHLSTQAIPTGGGADTDWTETANGIYRNGNVAINTTAIDSKSNLYVYRSSSETGADSSAIYGYRNGISGLGNGGINWSESGVDVAIKGTSNWGNEYSAGVAGFGYLDYANSAAVIGGQWGGQTQGALGYRDSEKIWAGYFNGDVRMMPQRPSTINAGTTADLHIDIKRTYIDQGEFGYWHNLYLLPTSKGLVSGESALFYLGDTDNHFSAAYINAISPQNILSINGETRINSGDLIVGIGNKMGINTYGPQNNLHIKQTNSNTSIRIQDQSNTDYWENGIGLTTQNYKFYFNGTIKADVASADGAYIQGSDRKLKTDIEQLDNVLDKVMELKPSKYYYKDSKKTAKNKSYGFIAQEVQEIFPDIVRHNEDDGNLALAYDDFAILAIKAIQEQQTTIEEVEKQNEMLKAENEVLKNDIADIKNMLASLNLNTTETNKTENISLSSEKASLAQNSPNPFTNDTNIEYYIPENVNTAQLQITNLNGQIINIMDIATRGNTKTAISAGKLTAGTYLYSLVLDGKTVDTKQMVLVK